MTPLAVHSYYSLMWGTESPAKICRAAKQRGYSRLALTDTNNLYGLWPFLAACEHEGLRPIVGAELTDRKTPARAVCLVENSHGYSNLCRLITRRHHDPGFDLKGSVPLHAKGLVVLTQEPTILPEWHAAGVTVAAAVYRKPSGNALRLRKVARSLGTPLVAVPGSFFLDPDGEKIHRMLRAIERNTSLSRLKAQETAPPDAWLADPATYAKRFHVWPETIRASDAIAERLTFSGPEHGTVLPPFADAKMRSPGPILRRAAYRGARRRYGDDLPETVVDRLEHELKIIAQMGFASYFLVARDIVSRSPRTCGRGSGAASLVAYVLGITNVCPIKHNLYFERFLNPGRSDPPDIDVDFAWDERDDVIEAVLSKHRGQAAMVCNHVTFKPKMAIRETAKVFGLPESEITRFSKRLPDLSRPDFPHPWPEILSIARRIVGIPRHLAVHPGGVIITPGPIDSYVPVEPAPKGVSVIQWEKDAAEESGLVKIDLLGNRSLGVIRDALDNLAKNRIRFDESAWDPEDDPATRANVAHGNTMGCFYIESPAMRLLQEKTGKGDFEHLVIHSSIIRPAANEYIREYVRRLRGGPWKPIHPYLKDVLDETFGIMVYQEDVSRTAVAIAGFSHAEADGLRKVMSKKDKVHKLKDYQRRFLRGARRRGVDEARIEAVWNMMMSFSGYSFCKPHSASYARVSFQAAYLKTHFPAEFMAAVISNRGGFYSTFAYVSEARRMGLRVLPPDVNRSALRCKGKSAALRVGLSSVFGLGRNTSREIVAKRKAGPYRNLWDFLTRVKPEEPEARCLIQAGAFDSLHPKDSRAALLWELALWQKTGSRGAGLFFGSHPTEKPVFPPDDERKRLREAYAALGFLCDRHPMTLFAARLRNRGIVKARDLHHYIGKQVRIAGLLITGKVVHTRQGEPMEFLTFEDETGLVETTFFPRTYRRFCDVLDKSRPFILSGKIEEDFGAVTLTVQRIEAIRKVDASHNGGSRSP